jgi:hypothetical protein
VTTESHRNALADEFERHMAVEDAILKSYHSLVDRLPDGPLSILVNHIATEEEMHHFLLGTLADWLRSPPLMGEEEVALGADRETVAGQARLLKEHETETIDACKKLKEEVSGVDGDLFEVLLDVLILDSQKHHRLLSALEKLVGS